MDDQPVALITQSGDYVGAALAHRLADSGHRLVLHRPPAGLLEYAPRGVCVNAIGTNYMDFPGFIAAVGAEDPERRAQVEQQVPLRRLGTMAELAEFTAVLLDGRSRFQAGQFFSFSGGWS